MNIVLCSEGDVYIVEYKTNYFKCYLCSIMPNGETAIFHGKDNILRHLKQHLAEGDKVPFKVLDNLQSELDKRK